ncbi:MAG: T3SS (YopN, CesT) and YbjN peptide-binding chaperone 1 [Jatrophihabitans sp.]|uniref:T3SS (YopN, CesT) and YbjN peptide-binding chaperone 1 n=1 Tax=Jatrophihabitans sp. TaxID=1932789 RepID=UPI003F7FB37C
MTEIDWVRSHVEVLLQRAWDVCRVHIDGDGDIGFRSSTAACWVTVLEGEPPMVRVWAHAAHGIKPTLAVLREINEIQARTLTAQVHHGNGVVVVSQTISPIGLTAPVLMQAVDAVSSVAADIGPLFAAMFGGSTPFPAEASSDEEVP